MHLIMQISVMSSHCKSHFFLSFYFIFLFLLVSFIYMYAHGKLMKQLLIKHPLVHVSSHFETWQ